MIMVTNVLDPKTMKSQEVTPQVYSFATSNSKLFPWDPDFESRTCADSTLQQEKFILQMQFLVD
jgi:hypothetical protein